MPVVDIHTHIYPPSYISLLRARTTVPYIRRFPSAPDEDRLVILPGEDTDSSTAHGRPLGPAYSDIAAKLQFMDAHNITTSVLSLANPWLDFLSGAEASRAAVDINNDINSLCSLHPGRLYALGTLPLKAGAAACVEEVRRLRGMRWMRGVVMGTGGMGSGLEGAEMERVWEALQGWTVFVHPHYGLPGEVWGERGGEWGHVLPLALGFPLETTIAVARLYLSRAFDRYPKLQLLLAHSGGTLPFLAGRLESCIAHDAHLKKNGTAPKRDIWEVLTSNILLDAVIYSEVGLKAAMMAAGSDRLLFGTDHPFFPPLETEAASTEGPEQWLSVTLNYSAIQKAAANNEEAAGILGGNAVRLLNLTEVPEQ